MVANVVKFIAVEAKFDLYPNFLVQQEQVNVVEKRGDLLFAESIVPASRNDDGRAAGQVRHRVAETGAWRLPCSLYSHKIALDHFAVNSDWLEVPQLVGQLAISLFATKEIDAIHNRITLCQC